jgi:hypothetical protein
MVGTLEDALARKGARLQLGTPSVEAETNDEPPVRGYDARVFCKAVRIDLPFVNVRSFARVAELLRDLANDFEAASKERLPPPTHPDYHRERRLILLDMSMRADTVRRQLRELHGNLNKNGTLK